MREVRVYDLRRISMRSENDGSPGTFGGHAIVFGERTEIGNAQSWGFWEQVDAGAVDRAISEEHDVRLLLNHNPDHLLARTKSGTLTLEKKSKGLYVEAPLPNTTVGRDLAVLLERGDIDQMSFAFQIKAEKWESLDDGSELRTILDMDLFDVSPVTYPAYKTTDASLRSAAEAIRARSPRARERWEAANKKFLTISQGGK